MVGCWCCCGPLGALLLSVLWPLPALRVLPTLPVLPTLFLSPAAKSRERERDGGVSPMSNCNHNMPAGYGITTAVCTAMPVCHSTAVRTPYPLGFYSSSRQGGVGGAGQSHRHVVMGFTDDSTQPTVCYGSGRVHSTLTGNWHLDRRTHRMGLCGVRQASQSGGLSAAGRGGDSH